MILVDPDILGGSEAVIKGTRVPARDIACAANTGVPVEDILRSYPSITAEQIAEAVAWDRDNPPQPKPLRPLSERVPPGARVLVSGTVPQKPSSLGD
ncbi:DUF433 domain-containing protein [Roseicella frigidaeris]|uniref:DUF433 domain-containing protein n=1 Tax=Roseicella frigidaeris TaxID=2230885 RepID=A0A327LWT9_9PROT|nr:DUF433 domain-containing protein [Roseicella frigidaeris]RAI54653.1 hypothetical protein DOO78_25605 [Roseicella frigidaeris]